MLAVAALFTFSFSLPESAPVPPATQRPSKSAVSGLSMVINVPRIAQPPKIEEFEHPEVRRADMLKLDAFVQRAPHDGTTPTQRTEIFLGYDHENLYVVWMCHDKEQGRIRAHMGRRENVFDDDYVEMMLDTFHDQRRAFVFSVNPVGVQADGLFTENGGGNDTSWDTVWNSWGRVMPFGYVVLESIPFRSLRFKPGEGSNRWGVTFMRWITRSDETDFLPAVSQKQAGVHRPEAPIASVDGIESPRKMTSKPYLCART